MPFLRRFLILAFALFPLLVVASAQAAITARVTYQSHAAYLANGNPAPGTLVFLRSPADGDQNNAVGVAWQELNGNVSNLPVNLGNTPGWFRVVYNDRGADQAIGCTTSPLSHSNFQYLADGQSIDITITCTMPPPNVTDARISIAGATGNGGVFRRGDSVTARWNNTASGDNNSGVTAVSVDFSQFGGGAAVAAENNAGIWTATSAVAAGITASNRNVSLTATNSIGSTTRADTSNATVDSVVPTVVSIAPASGASASNTTVNFTASFSEAVTGVSTDDFTLVPTGSATGSIASVSGSGGSYTVTVNGITGNGTLKLNLNGSTNISDTAGNSGLAAFTAGTVHTVAIATAPGAPTIDTATAGDAQASVSFSAPASNGGSAITGYMVTSNPGSITAGGNGFTTSPITLSGLSNGTAYTFTVTATNAVGTSTPSAASNSVTPKANQTITFTNPGAQNFGTTPTLTATASSGLPVSFSSATTGVCTITSGGSLTFITAGTCTINADQAGNAATNAATTIGQSFLVNAVVPAAPVIGTTTAGNAQASVSFSAPVTTGGSSITGYTVTANPGGATASGVASPLVVSGLSNGQAYTFTVTASNVAGTGPASAASNAVTPAAPQIITFGNPGAQNFGTTPTLSASASSGLTVSFSSPTPAVCTITSGGSLAFIAAGTCTINANQAGNAAWLAATTVSQTFNVNPVVPEAPTIGTATGGDTQARVSFSAPVNTGGSSITGYTVTANPGGATASGAASPLVVSGLSNGQAYTFTVTAINVAGTGPASAASNAVTPAAPQVITFATPGAQNFGTTPTLSASASSGLTVSFSSATPAVCTITSGGLLGFASTGSCTIHADQPGNASYLPAPRVSRTFSVNGVVPGAPTIGTAAVTSASAVSVGFSAPLFDGGAAITGYTVISSPGGLTATGVGSPIVVTGLTPGASYTFVVTATNANGTGAASAPSNAVTPVPPLAVAPVSATVVYGAASPISLVITGVASSVAVATAPAHGSAVASGTTITYTPAPGYAGSDSFSYTASDAYTTTAAATVSITVSAPLLSLTTPALPAATGSAAYAQTLAASGGSAPYRFAVSSGALPPGLVLASDGALGGTPTQAGSFAFAITVTDSSTGTGPFTATQGYVLVVGAPVLSVDPLPAATGGQAYRVQLNAQGGAAPYAFIVGAGTLPPGLLLSASGEVSGIPTAAGSYEFSLQVADANGFTTTQAFTQVVDAGSQLIQAFVATPEAPVFAPGGTFALSASGGASGNPVVFASLTPTVCQVQGSTVTMLTAGQCSLSADQAGNATYQAAAQVRLDVAIALATPELGWIDDISKVYGEDAFELPEPQSSSPGTFSFSSSDPAVATVSGRTVTLVGEGVTVLTATQAATASYTAASIQVRLLVSARPNPTADPRVASGLQAQVDASVQFAQIQSGNIRDRLRQVRGGSVSNDFRFALTQAGGQGVPGLTLPKAAADSVMPRLPEGWGMWVAGSASFGRSGRTGLAGGADFSSRGLTVGIDHAVDEQVLLGMAGSWARQDTDLDSSSSRLDADQRSLAVYGLWRVGGNLFVDGMLANGWLDFDSVRWNDLAQGSAQGQRSGEQWFGSLTFGHERHNPAGMALTSYGRYDWHRATLDGYSENGLGAFDLTYGRQRVVNNALALGVQGSFVFTRDWGSLRPHWTVEYRSALDNRGQATINYVVRPAASDYVLDLRSYNDDLLSLGAGMDLQLDSGWLFSLLLGHEQGRNAMRSNSIGLQVRYGQQGAYVPMYSDEAGAQPAGDSSRPCRGSSMRCTAPPGARPR